MTLETTETAVKITGKCAKEISVMLYAILNQQKKTNGKVRLVNMLKTGKELKVFAVQDSDLVKFCKEAKKYGVLYCVLKDKDANDSITDVIVRAEDASKVNRIFDRFKLTTVDMASVISEIERDKVLRNSGNDVEDKQKQSREDVFLDALMEKSKKEEVKNLNPKEARTENLHQSVPFSERREQVPADGRTKNTLDKRTSVRQALKDIRNEMNSRNKNRSERQKETMHKAPKKAERKER